MAIDPGANDRWLLSHQLILPVGTRAILEGIAFQVTAVTNGQVTFSVDTTVPGSTQGAALRPFGAGQITGWGNVLWQVYSWANPVLTLQPADLEVELGTYQNYLVDTIALADLVYTTPGNYIGVQPWPTFP